ncbi:MAG: UDP-3-O-(3-hydroxymyristoyl)glucosamine N-acyltransferase [Gammaproteobacteria bacterium]|nr:UDP-3-O-(3-hydroxymyristoyl)glucosamine N-acyltransferase [Gammaproteobacteria bacterium]
MAQAGELSHLSARSYRRYLPDTRATAVILNAEDAAACPTNCLIVANPYLAFARASALFVLDREVTEAIHPSAVIASDAILGEGVTVGAHAVVGARTILGAGVSVAANSTIGADCDIGEHSSIGPNVVIYRRVRMGARCKVHGGAVIGADGFGFVPAEDGRLVEIAQLGGVVMGSDVRIGANTTIDRGAIGDTRIGDGVKIDNQVQLGHNCIIGDHTIICGCVGIVGSTRVGKHCVLAGQSALAVMGRSRSATVSW